MVAPCQVDIRELIDFAHGSDRITFTTRFPHLFLVVAGHDKELPVSFKTEVISVRPAKQASIDEVLPIIKAVGNPYPERIALGRARNCDIVLRDRSVSKLHAHFRVESQGMLLVDLESSNGTYINGQLLKPNQPSPVLIGDSLHFGKVRTELLDAHELFKRL